MDTYNTVKELREAHPEVRSWIKRFGSEAAAPVPSYKVGNEIWYAKVKP